MTKPKLRPCPSCQALNQANRKTCSSCLCRLQVKHDLQKRQAAMQSSKWVDSVRKHRNSSRIITSAQLSVLKLHELGYRPVLFIGQKDRKGHMVADVIHQVDQRQGPVLEILMKMTRLYEDLLRNVQQLLVTDEDVPPEQQDWIPGLDQEVAHPPHIKEEQEEADVTEFPFTRVSMKSEDGDEIPHSSQLRQSQMEGDKEAEPEADGEVCGGPQLYRPAHPGSDGKASDSSEPETVQSEFNTVKHHEALVSDACEKPCSCTECGKRLYSKRKLKDQRRVQTGEKPCSCTECEKRLYSKHKLKDQRRVQTGEKPYSCTECEKRLYSKHKLKDQRRVQTGEKPYSCTECEKRLYSKHKLKDQRRVQTGEKPYSCTECEKRLYSKHKLKDQRRVQTGEKPCSCTECGRRFISTGCLKRHMTNHRKHKQFWNLNLDFVEFDKP